MRRSKATLVVHTEGTINTEGWVQEFAQVHQLTNIDVIRQAVTLTQHTGAEQAAPNGQSCLNQGLVMAEILGELHVDPETLAAAIVYSSVRYADLSLEDVGEQLGKRVAKLVAGAKQMDAIRQLHDQLGRQTQQNTIDNLRKMLLAIVDDVRVVLIKFAERLCLLRNMGLLDESERKKEAREIMDIYAPLANRLGIGHLKWELEDLAFRYLEPEIYKHISKSLNARRDEREAYVHQVIKLIEDEVKSLGISNTQVTGRAKHIYSIYRKMQRKKVDIDQIYDATAFRILVPTIEDCYAVLGHAHSLWKHVPKEFDDYIANPKPNGYRSIHTAVYGPDDQLIEIQIRTFDIHQESELGVAAHWVYKEGAPTTTGYEAKIAWLRQVMDWQKEVTEKEEKGDQVYEQIFDDTVYVFTPNGEVVDLPKGATPLDFAYHIHTQIGHRCRGAKINGHMVPLTYQLKTGESVEILTTKQEHPSRDWLNSNLGYLKTSRAKAKVLSWFRKQDYDQNREDGNHIFEREIKRLGLKNLDQSDIAKALEYKTTDDMFAALGRGDLHFNSLINILQPYIEHKTLAHPTTPLISKPKAVESKTDIKVEGVGNLLTHMALCCKPIPGDPIVGYVTQGQGVSIHRQDCTNILNISDQQKERLIQTTWGDKTHQKYLVDLTINSYDRPGLARDITHILASENTSITRFTCVTDKNENTAYFTLTIEVSSLQPLSRIIAQINQLPNIIEVKRVT